MIDWRQGDEPTRRTSRIAEERILPLLKKALVVAHLRGRYQPMRAAAAVSKRMARKLPRVQAEPFAASVALAAAEAAPGEAGLSGEEGLGLTWYEQAKQERTDAGDVPEGVRESYVGSERSGASFFRAITEFQKKHKYGAAVEVKKESFYTDPSTRLYLAPDASAGVAVTKDGDLVSVFKFLDLPRTLMPS